MSKKYTYWLNSGKYSMIQKVLVLILGVFSFMMIARMLSQEKLGVWGLFLVISGIVETARNALIRNGYILFMKTSPEEEHAGIEAAALFTNIGYTLIMILIFIGGGALIANLLNAPGLNLVLFWYSLSMLALVAFSQMEITLTARMDFKGIASMYIVRNVLFTGVVAVCFFGGAWMDLDQLSWMYLVSVVAGSVIGWLYLRKRKVSPRKWNTALLKRFINYGKFVLGNNISSLIFRNTDAFLTSSLISPAVSAIYSACTRITNFADMPSQVLGDIMFPKAAQVMKSGGVSEIRALYEKTVAATLTFTIPVVLVVVLFAKQILIILAGEKYGEASGILQIVIFYGMFLPFIRQFGNIMDVTGRPKVNFMIMFIFAMVNIVLNVTAIYLWGVPGSAIGTLTSYFLLFLTAYTILRKLFGVSVINVLKNITIFYPEYFRLVKSTAKTYLKPGYEK